MVSRLGEREGVIEYIATQMGGEVIAYHRLSDSFPIGTLRTMLADARWSQADLQRLDLLT